MKRRPLYLHDLTPNAEGKHVTFWAPYPPISRPTIAEMDNLFLRQCGIQTNEEKSE